MPPDSARLLARRYPRGAGSPRPVRGARPARLSVADVALFHGERSGGIRTYLEAKVGWARRSGLIEHHVIVPGRSERHFNGRHELPSLSLEATNGYRLPLGAGVLKDTLRALRPDVVVLHDPFWRPLGVTQTAHDIGASVVAVHHGSTALDAAGLPGPDALWQPLLRTWMHRAYRDADAIMSAVDPRADCGRHATIALRFGIDPEFVPHPDVARQDHVLYVGRLGREKGVVELLEAAARSALPWQLKLVGRGPIEQQVPRLARKLGIADRVRMYPFIANRGLLAHWYASARVVVTPGAHETFGLAAFEAAATGTPVVTCSTAPSAALMSTLVHTYEPGNIDGLLAAIESARAARPAAAAGDALGRRCSWGAAFAAETLAIERLVHGRRRPLAVVA